MTYIVKVNRESLEFEPLVKMIAAIKRKTVLFPERKERKYDPSFKEQAKRIILEEHGINIGELNHEERYTTVDFGNEQNYIWFLLRWA